MAHSYYRGLRDLIIALAQKGKLVKSLPSIIRETELMSMVRNCSFAAGRRRSVEIIGEKRYEVKAGRGVQPPVSTGTDV